MQIYLVISYISVGVKNFVLISALPWTKKIRANSRTR